MDLAPEQRLHRNKNWTNVFFGILVMIIPFLGLPVWMKNYLLLAFGLIITLVALSSQRPM